MKRLVGLAGGIAVVLALAGCSSGSSEVAESSSDAGSSIEVNEELFSMLPEDIQESGVITVGAPYSLKPSIFTEDDGTPSGIAVDLSTALGEVLGVTFEWQESDDPVTAIQSGTIDVSIGYLSDSPSREEALTMVPTYLNTSTLLVTSGSEATDIESMCGMTLAVVSGSQQEVKANSINEESCADDSIDILGFSSASDALAQVQSGRADAFAAQRMVLQGVVDSSDGAFAVTDADYADYPFAMGFAQDNSDMAEAFSLAMQELLDNGTYDEILSSWDVSDLALTADQMAVNAGSTDVFEVNQG